MSETHKFHVWNLFIRLGQHMRNVYRLEDIRWACVATAGRVEYQLSHLVPGSPSKDGQISQHLLLLLSMNVMKLCRYKYKQYSDFLPRH